MNVLQINTVCGTGSIGRIASDLQGILMSQGHQSNVAYGRVTANAAGNTVFIGSRLETYAHVAWTRLFDRHGLGSARATRRFIEEIGRLDPDVIHLHNVHGYYLHVGILFDYLKQAGKPVVWTLHDCWSFTGHCVHFDFIGCERWKSGCYACPLKSEYPKSILQDGSKRNYLKKKASFAGVPRLTLVTPSQWLSRLVGASFLRCYPVEVIPNGIDLAVFKATPGDFRERHGLTGKFLILGVASVWNERKGYQYFCDLAKQLSPDEKIVLVGLDREKIRSLPPGIVGIAKTHSTVELAEIYSAADLFLNPTLEDNFPTTNLEALACGTPVVTFNSGGSPECLAEGCGAVVERGDLPGLVAAIAAVKAGGKGRYTACCQKRARDAFDKNDRFQEYVALYKRSL